MVRTIPILVSASILCSVAALPSGAAAPAQMSPRFTATILEQAPTLRPHVLELALEAYVSAREQGLVRRPRLTVIDYELPSYEKRLWVIDLPSARVLLQEWVSHGMGSPKGSGGDLRHALSFSNAEGSRKSSLGGMITAETYQGRHGYSLRLDGVEPGINDAARPRTIVIHGASYVSARRAAGGSLGRSWGCPAVRQGISRTLIDAVKGGSLVWGYYPDRRWLRSSTLLPDGAADSWRLAAGTDGSTSPSAG